MKRSKRLYEEALRLFPGGVNSPARALKPYSFFVESASGSRLRSTEGIELIDYCLGFGPLILGHQHPKVLEAIREQLERGWLYGVSCEEEIRFAKRILRHYSSMDMIRFVNSGAEATMNAIRLARGYTKREKIIKFDGNYHGSHDSVLVKAGSSAAELGVPASLGIMRDSVSSTIVVPYNDPESVEDAIKKNRGEVAAVIGEPVAVNMGLVPPKPGFLGSLREICDRNDVMFILDEVVTGCRLALGGAQEYFDIEADITTLGKIIGGGFPIGGYGARRELMEKVAPLGPIHNAGTFNAHPMAMAAGEATVRVLEETDALRQASQAAERLAELLKNLVERHGLEAGVNRFESMFQIFFTKVEVVDYVAVETSNKALYMKYLRQLMEKGVYMAPSQVETCFTSSEHSEEDLEQTEEALTETFKELFR
ncbi:MAG: glutamate-1-semialdehyde 2,1-aminomutase [Nitrososphaeria archaeon]|nr:glutamate-1-semialdehyde 2,1-aminomutase [Nitrososphaeria archaeon]NIQ33241.1 glutamate-1-semialdehyde 2,1-aminomutase [Nitrososphaeria archaeon]